jgi:hypothetical protein
LFDSSTENVSFKKKRRGKHATRRGDSGFRSAIAAFTSLVLAVAVGSLVSRALFSSAVVGSNQLPGLILTAVILLLSGFAYRRWFFTAFAGCVYGVCAYVVTIVIGVTYLTGANAFAGILDSVFVWLVIASLLPWLLGFGLSERGRQRAGRHARRRMTTSAGHGDHP